MSKRYKRSKFLKLIVHDQKILLPLSDIKMVVQMVALHPMPSNINGFEGTLNYHGVSVPVYNMGNWIENKPVKKDLDTPVVLCELNEALLGLLVSTAEHVLPLKKDDIQQPTLNNIPPYVKGIYEQKKEGMWVVALDALFRSQQEKEI